MTPQAPPADAQSAISAALGRDNVVYHALAEGRGFRVENPDHALSAEFTRAGVRLRSGAAMLGLRLHSIGYGSGLRAVKAPAPRAEDNRVEYRRGTVTEWYINGPLGLEQGFTLESPPPGRNGGPLTLAIALSGDLTATLDSPGDSITLTNAVDGSAVLRYGGLTASDAAGRRLAARLEIEGREILLSVDDHDARYPIVVDPLVQQARLTASDGVAFGLLGYSIAIDHDTIVVGAPGGVEDAAYLFVKPAAGWSTTSTFTAKLLPSDVLGGDFYGYPVAIRGDTVVVGAFYGTPEHDLSLNGSGAVYVFTKPAGGWTSTSDAVKLLPATLQSYSGEPTWNVDSAAVGDDEILIGHRYADEGSGAVSVFSRPPAGWGTAPAPYPLINESARLTLPDGVGGGDFGGSLALSGDTLVVGADLAATDPDNRGSPRARPSFTADRRAAGRPPRRTLRSCARRMERPATISGSHPPSAATGLSSAPRAPMSTAG